MQKFKLLLKINLYVFLNYLASFVSGCGILSDSMIRSLNRSFKTSFMTSFSPAEYCKGFKQKTF